MKKSWYYALVSFLTLFLLLNTKLSGGKTSGLIESQARITFTSTGIGIQDLYQNINGEAYNLSFEAFRYAMLGYLTMKSEQALQNDKILTIIDFTKDSCQKRFYTIDLTRQRIVYNTFVSHGQKSGSNICTKFSDTPESHQSSIGFYTTGNTYIGKHGQSLRLHGNEKGYNANAYKRAVVVHGADYVSERFIKNNGRLGRSHGCPALPMHLHKEIINTIKDGSLIFAYYNDAKYLSTSKYLKNTNKVLFAQI